jgi:putative ABC transport system substrate-binding protein
MRLSERFLNREGLNELGYVEGKNIILESRYAEGKTERLPDLSAALVRLKLDVIVAGTNSEIAALKQATMTVATR